MPYCAHVITLGGPIRAMLETDRRALLDRYRAMLFDDVVPFWMRHSLDWQHGGYLHHLDRDGSVYCEDKMMWMEWRQVYMLSRLYLEVEPRAEWLDAARL